MGATSDEIKLCVDLDAALARVRGNKALYKRMLGMFLESQEFANFEAALEEKNYAHGAEIAHGIKGMTGNLGLTLVFEASEKLMQEMRQGPPSEALVLEYGQNLAKTRSAVKQLVEELE